MNDLNIELLQEPERLVSPGSWVGHIPFAFWLVQTLKPRVLVELGTHTGNSYLAFCQAIARHRLDTRAHAVDTWEGDEHAGAYDDSVFLQLKRYHDPKYGSFSTLQRKTFDQALDLFSTASIDLLHIDGLHTYEAVKHDFESWLPKVSGRGVVLFHDTNVYERGFGVHRLWDELVQRYPGFNFKHSNGLGVLLVGSERSPELMALVDGREDAVAAVQAARVFDQLGRQTEHHLLSLERGDRIRVLEAAIEDRDAQIRQFYAEIDKRDANILALHEERRAAQERFEVLVGQLQADIRNLAAQLEAQASEAARLHGQLTRSTATSAERLERIRALESSSSWRVTAPLRKSRSVIRRGQQIAARTNEVARDAYRRRGAMGLLRAIPGYVGNIGYHARNLTTPLTAIGQLGLEVVLPETPVVRPAQVRPHPDLLADVPTLDRSVTVVIPTLNAGREFDFLLRKLRQQKGLRQLEIVVVDSGSTDRTVELARRHGCHVVEILPEQFSHSYARNLGAGEATTDFLLFMVQDAYPIGDHWAYGMLSFLLDHASDNLIAVSCAEFSRSDSDIMYDSLINTHYKFLGCLEYDRIGRFTGGDHMSLRSSGQLSDVSCLIGREAFESHRYRGSYAEDLDLGIRLIRDGYTVAMLASVKVIHSHNRPTWYYFKRSFVDVIFLVRLFADFQTPAMDDARGLLQGIMDCSKRIAGAMAAMPDVPAQTTHKSFQVAINDWIALYRKDEGRFVAGDKNHSDDAALNRYLDGLVERYLPGPRPGAPHHITIESERFSDNFMARLVHFRQFAGQVFGEQDALLAQALEAVIWKSFASAAGAGLGFMRIALESENGPDQEMVQTIEAELRVGI
ncbi:MAG: class I SAM-dependent methyltransferase [Variovorax sp.]